jgi:hypothetical protein
MVRGSFGIELWQQFRILQIRLLLLDFLNIVDCYHKNVINTPPVPERLLMQSACGSQGETSELTIYRVAKHKGMYGQHQLRDF